MANRILFETWAPPASLWSRWAKPVLFAETLHGMLSNRSLSEKELDAAKTAWALPNNNDTAIVLDVPGETAVLYAVALANKGYQPVALFNTTSGSRAAIDVSKIKKALTLGAANLRGMTIPAKAPPAFILDSERKPQGRSPKPGQYDNRWVVLPQDFPSGRFLMNHGIRNIVILRVGTKPAADDLSHILVRWQERGLRIRGASLNSNAAAGDIRVTRPNLFRLAFSRLLVMFGLRRNSAGGFGAVVPEESSGGGYYG